MLFKEVNIMLMLIAVLVTLVVLRKCKLYHKELGNSGITVQHVMNVFIYVLLFCVCPIFALILFLTFDAKTLYNKFKESDKNSKLYTMWRSLFK